MTSGMRDVEHLVPVVVQIHLFFPFAFSCISLRVELHTGLCLLGASTQGSAHCVCSICVVSQVHSALLARFVSLSCLSQTGSA